MTIKEALEKGRKALLNKGDSPFLDCRLLVSHVTNLSFSSLITMEEKVLSSKEEELFNKLLEKRINHVPMAYILGKKNFFGYDFLTPGNVLIPRPDTEILIESAISDICNSYKNRVSILDLCSGSGCIGITLALELKKKGFKVNLTLTDISPEAVEVSLNNCHLLLKDHDIEYKVLQGDLFS
ncbi:MAG: peptide chain release factor N(5)-glutamine methyltransferase, partial [Sphaerochaetaceae bacterium]|nr:peptide chain release factor N(5)-glutamine methyltransferase [Sphaerochaetaceae bacterium]